MTRLRGQLQHNHPLANYTSWRIGGPARIFYQPLDLDDLTLFLQTLPPHETNIIWLGLGSNVLIHDSGIDGVVIHTKHLNKINVQNMLYAEAGVPLAKFAPYYPFLAGIPGTVGGALAMNAGAFGDEIWNHVSEVTTIDRYGKHKLKKPSDFKINYRSVIMPPNEWFISAKFNLTTVSQDPHELLQKRAATQPIGELTCGSVFRNPANDYAARLIEICGLKGQQIGAAQVSEKHANFIINTGQASSADVEKLINYIQDQVQQQTGVVLTPEVHVLGGPHP